MSSGKATLLDCQTIYSVEDVYLLLELIAVDSHNQRRFDEWRRAQEK